MPGYRLNRFRHHVRRRAMRPHHPRFEDRSVRYRPNRFLRLAYAVRRPGICYGCICLTRSERDRQRRVLALARAWGRAVRDQGA